jgi:protease-4
MIQASRGNHVFLEIPGRFQESEKSFFLRLLQPEKESPFFFEFMANLRILLRDNRVKFLSIMIPDLDYGFAEVESIRNLLEKLRNKGVWLRGFAETGDLKTLYLLSICQERFSTETGEFRSILPSTDSFFFGQLFKNQKVKVDVFQSGPYKSFGEIFTRKDFSKPARENLEILIKDLREIIVRTVCSESKLKDSDLQRPILTSGFLNDTGYLNGWIDKRQFRENFLYQDLTKIPREESVNNEESTVKQKKKKKQDKKFSFELSWKQIRRKAKVVEFSFFGSSNDLIAILPLKGEIISAKESRSEWKSGSIDSYAVENILEEWKSNPNIKAILLEIDSPGGSATDSERIHQALKSIGKTIPVYSFLSNTCASGGYYIACAGKKIYSSKIGIVGSIGTIMMRFDLSGFYQKWGITRDRIGFYPMREVYSETGPLSRESVAFLKKEIDRVESLFLRRVAESRNPGAKVLETYSGGRVFSPERFAAGGMIDSILGYSECLDEIKKIENLISAKVIFGAPKYNIGRAIRESIPFIRAMIQYDWKDALKVGLEKLNSLETDWELKLYNPWAERLGSWFR